VTRKDHPRAGKDGYVKRAVVVVEALLGRPLVNGEDVHHINGIKTDDRPENLRVMNRSDHMREHNQGTRNHSAKLTEDDVRAILAAAGHERRTETMKRFGVSRTVVRLIQERKLWKHVSPSLGDSDGEHKDSVPALGDQ
jgi:hypothetical protein